MTELMAHEKMFVRNMRLRVMSAAISIWTIISWEINKRLRSREY